VIYKTPHRQLKIELHDLHAKSGVNSGAPEGWEVPACSVTLVENLVISHVKVADDYYDKWNICDTDKILIQTGNNRIDSVMINLLDSTAVDRGFEPRSNRTKHYQIGICCYST
jgi:hypothetical protein